MDFQERNSRSPSAALAQREMKRQCDAKQEVVKSLSPQTGQLNSVSVIKKRGLIRVEVIIGNSVTGASLGFRGTEQVRNILFCERTGQQDFEENGESKPRRGRKKALK